MQAAAWPRAAHTHTHTKIDGKVFLGAKVPPRYTQADDVRVNARHLSTTFIGRQTTLACKIYAHFEFDGQDLIQNVT